MIEGGAGGGRARRGGLFLGWRSRAVVAGGPLAARSASGRRPPLPLRQPCGSPAKQCMAGLELGAHLCAPSLCAEDVADSSRLLTQSSLRRDNGIVSHRGAGHAWLQSESGRDRGPGRALRPRRLPARPTSRRRPTSTCSTPAPSPTSPTASRARCCAGQAPEPRTRCWWPPAATPPLSPQQVAELGVDLVVGNARQGPTGRALVLAARDFAPCAPLAPAVERARAPSSRCRTAATTTAPTASCHAPAVRSAASRCRRCLAAAQAREAEGHQELVLTACMSAPTGATAATCRSPGTAAPPAGGDDPAPPAPFLHRARRRDARACWHSGRRAGAGSAATSTCRCKAAATARCGAWAGATAPRLTPRW